MAQALLDLCQVAGLASQDEQASGLREGGVGAWSSNSPVGAILARS